MGVGVVDGWIRVGMRRSGVVVGRVGFVEGAEICRVGNSRIVELA